MPRKVDPKKCIGCGTCVSACPVNAITLKDVKNEDGEVEKKAIIDPDTCIDCGSCEAVCPQSAISPAEE